MRLSVYPGGLSDKMLVKTRLIGLIEEEKATLEVSSIHPRSLRKRGGKEQNQRKKASHKLQWRISKTIFLIYYTRV
jgi:hypothetical protein